MIYLIPPIPGNQELVAMCGTAKVKLIEVDKLYRLIQATAEDGDIVAAVTEEALLLLSRYVTELLPSLPEVVMAIPDVHYSAQWSIQATRFPARDYERFQLALLKPGHKKQTREDLQSSLAHDFGTDPRRLPDEELNFEQEDDDYELDIRAS